ncbi:unnamed protein product [Plutella xylostella]|uniref:(diamondback moth) hypothetical protein n=1 Tax=Plutella xylostella TaxID=51655 RepID=A0A8S4FP45_PLUXY|nr:unnamed protein product [Plutella xylostella]
MVTEYLNDETNEVDEWLEQNELGDYKKLYKDLVAAPPPSRPHVSRRPPTKQMHIDKQHTSNHI